MGQNSGQPWTAREIKYVQDNYQSMTTKQIAAKLGRGYGGVAYKIQQMGLRKEPTYGQLQNAKKHKVVDAKKRASNGRAFTSQPEPVAAPKKPWWKFW